MAVVIAAHISVQLQNLFEYLKRKKKCFYEMKIKVSKAKQN